MGNLSVVIVSYNTRDVLLECLASLERARDEAAFEVIVVDNASPDTSVASVVADFPWVSVIERTANQGFATALNAGISACSSEFVFALNPDCIVPRNSIPKILNVIALKGRKHIFGCQLSSPRGERQVSSFRFPSLYREFWNFIPELKSLIVRLMPVRGDQPMPPTNLQAHGYLPELRSVEAISGAAFVMSRDTWEEVGRLDEEFFLYHEEIDFCTRASKMGIPVSLAETPIIHHDGQSSGYRTTRFPQQPLLGWRLSGMARLWQKHRPGTPFRMWQFLASTMLKLRVFALKSARLMGLKDSNYVDKRAKDLSELAAKLAQIGREGRS